jgi:hypothetical protein
MNQRFGSMAFDRAANPSGGPRAFGVPFQRPGFGRIRPRRLGGGRSPEAGETTVGDPNAPVAVPSAFSGAAGSMAGRAGSPSPQSPNVATVPLKRTPSPTGTPLGVRAADSHQAWRGPVQPGATPVAQPLPADTRDEVGYEGRELPIGAPATAAENPSGVPGVYETPGGGGLTMVQTSRPGRPQSESNNPMIAPAANGAPGQSQPVAMSSGAFSGGFGGFSKRFSNPVSAGIYHSFVQNLFGGQSGPGDISGFLHPARNRAVLR